jgi:ATP adenylyltransferase/5',5'''-P-1,P-4-tetraphosphate phosphorylase II
MGQPQPRNQTDLPINKAHIKNALKVIEHLNFEHPIFSLRRDDHLVQLHMCRMVYFTATLGIV